MQLSLSNCGKKYLHDWIFRKLSLTLETGDACAVTGPNGSGKSTLLQTIAGNISLSEGQVEFRPLEAKTFIETDQLYRYLSVAAPYLELIEELTLTELVNFHRHFKPILHGKSAAQLIDIMGLQQAKNKPLHAFSSGMKQRVKLALAIYSDSQLLILDEPSTNLDEQGVNWYLELVTAQLKNRITVIGSNMSKEHSFCNRHVSVTDYQKKPSTNLAC